MLGEIKMAQSESDCHVVPKPSEVQEEAKRWERDLAGIHDRYDALKLSEEIAFRAEKEAIAESVREKRAEQIARLDAEIHQYMQMVQADMDALLEELQAEKLQRLTTAFEMKQKENDEDRDRDLLDHLKRYKSIVGAESNLARPVSAPLPFRGFGLATKDLFGQNIQPNYVEQTLLDDERRMQSTTSRLLHSIDTPQAQNNEKTTASSATHEEVSSQRSSVPANKFTQEPSQASAELDQMVDPLGLRVKVRASLTP